MTATDAILIADRVRPCLAGSARRSTLGDAWVVTSLWVLILVYDDGSICDLTYV